MCLYVEDLGDFYMLDSGTHVARKHHKCQECGRMIDPGETYHYWTGISHYDGFQVQKMCAHCRGTISLGSTITGCPEQWWWGFVHDDRDPELGFVANILYDEGHELTEEEEASMKATVEGARAGWRDEQGELLPVPGAS